MTGMLMALVLAAGIRHAPRAVVVPGSVSDLPVVEIPSTRAGDTMAVLISGDGGWAAIDRAISGQFSSAGIGVAGLNALQYFWKKRTPDESARDVERIIRHYLVAWRRSRVVLIGYSRGADVLPFMVRRLPADLLPLVQLVVLMGPSERVSFEFHVSDWWRDSTQGLRVAPEIASLATPTLCMYGAEESDSPCPGLRSAKVKVVTLSGSHHFDGNYDALGKIILGDLAERRR